VRVQVFQSMAPAASDLLMKQLVPTDKTSAPSVNARGGANMANILFDPTPEVRTTDGGQRAFDEAIAELNARLQTLYIFSVRRRAPQTRFVEMAPTTTTGMPYVISANRKADHPDPAVAVTDLHAQGACCARHQAPDRENVQGVAFLGRQTGAQRRTASGGSAPLAGIAHSRQSLRPLCFRERLRDCQHRKVERKSASCRVVCVLAPRRTTSSAPLA
jgi:hypothetical protein